jgi:hypothetical protein
LLDRLVAGGSVTAKQLRDALADELWQAYQMQLENCRAERDMAAIGREIFADYNRKLRVANMLYGRCEQLKARSPHSKERFSNKVDSLYEDAVEELQQALASDMTAQAYIEAGYDDDPNYNTITHCPDGMPRLLYRIGNIATRDECKIRILTEAIAETDTCHGIGAKDLASGKLLTHGTLATRLNQQRVESIQRANAVKAIGKPIANDMMQRLFTQ